MNENIIQIGGKLINVVGDGKVINASDISFTNPEINLESSLLDLTEIKNKLESGEITPKESIKYLTGNDIRTYVNEYTGNTNINQLIFCTENATGNGAAYKAGKIYYFMNGTIKTYASPTNETITTNKTTTISKLESFNIQYCLEHDNTLIDFLTKSEEISNKKIYIAKAIAVIDDDSAIDTWSINYNSNSIITGQYEQLRYDKTENIEEAIEIDCSKNGIHEFKLDYAIKSDTTENSYKFDTNNISTTKILTLYTPSLIIINNNPIEKMKDISGNLDITVNLGDTIYFYTNKLFSTFLMGGYAVDSYTLEENKTHIVNDVEATYKYVYSIKIKSLPDEKETDTVKFTIS